MESWGTTILNKLDDNLKSSKQRDINFFRVEEFKRNIQRVNTFSKNCSVCEKQKIYISNTVDKIDEAINVPGQTRRDYDRLIGQLNKHMQKKHELFAPYHFTYLYSFFGMVSGLLLGYLLLKIFSNYNWEMLSIGFAIGLIGGYLLGGSKDSKIRANKKLM